VVFETALSQSPLRIEISTGKKSYALLSTVMYSVTITNMGGEALRNVSAKALFGRDIAPVEGSQLTAEKGNFAPGESLQLRFMARLRTLKKLDALLYPVRLICSLFASTALDAMPSMTPQAWCGPGMAAASDEASAPLR